MKSREKEEKERLKGFSLTGQRNNLILMNCGQLTFQHALNTRINDEGKITGK